MTTDTPTDGQELKGLIKVVSGDIQDALRAAKDQETAQAYRTAIRTIFSGAEAVIWFAKGLALAVARNEPASYSMFEMAALRDVTYTVAANGRVKSKPNFLPLTTSVKLISKLLSRGQQSDADFQLPQDLIAGMEKAVAIRHRLTHPKTSADLNVTREDMGEAMGTWMSVLTLGLNVALEWDKRLGTGMFPLRKEALPSFDGNDGSSEDLVEG